MSRSAPASRIGKVIRPVKAFGLASAVLALTACNSVYHSDTSENFSQAPLAAANGFPVQVDGMVGGVQGAPLAQAVAAAMPASIGSAHLQYAPCEEYTECAGDHLVWTFGPPAARPASAYPPAISRDIDWIGPYEPAPNNVTVKVALFENGDAVASTAGQVDASNPNDPAFQALIAAMTRDVLSGPGLLDWLL